MKKIFAIALLVSLGSNVIAMSLSLTCHSRLDCLDIKTPTYKEKKKKILQIMKGELDYGKTNKLIRKRKIVTKSVKRIKILGSLKHAMEELKNPKPKTVNYWYYWGLPSEISAEEVEKTAFKNAIQFNFQKLISEFEREADHKEINIPEKLYTDLGKLAMIKHYYDKIIAYSL